MTAALSSLDLERNRQRRAEALAIAMRVAEEAASHIPPREPADDELRAEVHALTRKVNALVEFLSIMGEPSGPEPDPFRLARYRDLGNGHYLGVVPERAR
jgi:hypothetical protein